MLAAIFLALSSLAPPGGIPTGGVDQTAIDAYRRGDYPSAKSLWIATLEAADAPGGQLPAHERARILYDLGNVTFRSGSPLEAVGWYTASLRLRPRDTDTWSNLEHARRTAKLEPADRGDLAATLWRLVTSLTLVESGWLALAVASVWAAVLAAEALLGGRLLRRLSLVGFFVTLASLGPWVVQRARADRDAVLVIAGGDGGAALHSEPRADAAVVATIALGEEIERQDELPGWVKVKAPDGTSGWIESEAAFSLRR